MVAKKADLASIVISRINSSRGDRTDDDRQKARSDNDGKQREQA